METSGFSDTQLQVREAISKICSKYPDVSIYLENINRKLGRFPILPFG